MHKVLTLQSSSKVSYNHEDHFELGCRMNACFNIVVISSTR